MTSVERLKESELIYRNLLETIDVGFYQVTLDGEMLNHNRAHNIILGYDPSESLKSKDVRQFWQNPKDRDIYVGHLLKHGFTKNYICHALTKNGENIIVELNSHLIKDENGKPIRIDGTFIDITEKFNLEKKLKESEERYRLISETAYDLIGILNKKFKYEYMNRNAFQQILGYENGDIIGKSALKFIHPDDISRVAKNLFEGFKRGEGESELRFRHKDGHWVWIESKGKTFIDNEGELKAIIISRDITERKIADDKLRKSEKDYRDLYEDAPNAYFSIGNDKTILRCNKAAEKLLGYTKDELSVMKVIELYAETENGMKKAKMIFKEFINGNNIKDEELQMKKKDGNCIWVSLTVKPLLDQFGNVVESRSMVLDINKRKKTEEALKKSEKKHREAYNKANFYKDLFAHDINNILHIVNSSAELISYHLGDSEKSKLIEEIGNIIKKQVERGTKLVSNVQTLSKLEDEEIHAQPTEICKLMENSIDFVKRAYQERIIHINNECLEDHLVVNANELLQDVFENILINSVKYNENSVVEVNIIVSKTNIDGKNYNKIEFIDNGIGVPDDRKQIIFKRGNRELKGAKGMGLGLSLVKKILETFDGKIWVEDKVKGDYSNGCKFIILLPELNSTN